MNSGFFIYFKSTPFKLIEFNKKNPMFSLVCIFGTSQKKINLLKNYIIKEYNYKLKPENELIERNNLNILKFNTITILNDINLWSIISKYPKSILIVIHSEPNLKFYESLISLNKNSNLYHIFDGTDSNILKQIPNLKILWNWDQYFMNIAFVVSYRSNCRRRKVGCVLVKDNRIISTGYNGTASGTLNCNEGGCLRCNSNPEIGRDLEKCLCLHAEENAILFSPLNDNIKLYTTLFPCILCSKKIIQFKIQHVYYFEEYSENDKEIMKIFDQINIKYSKVNKN